MSSRRSRPRLYLLEGKFAYAEPLRLALQNLALGPARFRRAADRDGRPRRGARSRLLDRDPGRLGKLENAISKQRTVRFDYWSISRDKPSERSSTPTRLLNDNGRWYVIGLDLDREAMRTFRVSRIRGDIQLRHAHASATSVFRPTSTSTSTAAALRGRSATCRRGAHRASGRHRLVGASAHTAAPAASRTRVCHDGYSSLGLLAAWVLRQDGRAIPLEPHELQRRGDAALRRVRGAPRLRARGAGEGDATSRRVTRGGDHSSGPVAPERFARPTGSARSLLAACGEENETEIPASEIVERFAHTGSTSSRIIFRCSTS